MQMIKNNKGVTIIVLVVIVVLLFILAGVGLNLSYFSIDKVKDNKLESELGMVRQAVSEQYWKAISVGETEVLASKNSVAFWVGSRITDFSDIDLPDENSITTTEKSEAFFDKESNYAPVFQEDFYYRLTPAELKQIGIGDSKATYVVNYATGEVYNETQKKDSKSQLLYLPAINGKQMNTEEKDDTFSDWNE